MRCRPVLWKYHKNKDGASMLKIEVRKGKRAYLPLNIYLYPHEWNGDRVKRTRINAEKINDRIRDALDKLEALQLEGNYTAPDQLISAYNNKELVDLYKYWQQIIDRYRKTGKEHSADEHESRMIFFKKFASTLYFSDVTTKWLDDFYIFCKEYRKTIGKKNERREGGPISSTTIHKNYKCLRTVFQFAIKEGVVSDTPFTHYKLPKIVTKPARYWNQQHISKLEAAEFTTIRKTLVKHSFLLSYYLGGMRVSDLIGLKWEHVPDYVISYQTSKSSKPIRFRVPAEAIAIMEYYKPVTGKGVYVLPWIKQKPSIRYVKNLIRRYNKVLKDICKELDLPPVSTHSARHTLAAKMVSSNVSLPVMQALFRHSDIKTTAVYISKFDEGLLTDTIEKLIKKPGTD